MPFVWTDSPLTSGTAEKIIHYNDFVTHLGTIYSTLSLNYGGCGPECGTDLSPKNQGDPILIADINDVRARTNHAYDNFCGTHHATDDGTHDNGLNIGYDGTNHVSYHGTDLVGYDATHYVSHNPTDETDNAGHDSVVYDPYHSNYKDSDLWDKTTYHSTVLEINNTGDELSYEAAFHSPYYGNYHSSYHAVYDATEHAAYDNVYYVTNLSTYYNTVG